jgi:hypothetical protein
MQGPYSRAAVDPERAKWKRPRVLRETLAARGPGKGAAQCDCGLSCNAQHGRAPPDSAWRAEAIKVDAARNADWEASWVKAN